MDGPTSHRDLGGYRLSNVQPLAMNSVAYRSHGLAKATTENVTLLEDTDHQPWYTNGGREQPVDDGALAGAFRLARRVRHRGVEQVIDLRLRGRLAAGPFAGGHLEDLDRPGQQQRRPDRLCQ